MKIRVDFNFEELDKLPIEKYNELEEKYLEFVTKLLTSNEEDYCKKKGWDRKKLTFEQQGKMRRAVNNRKYVKIAGENLMMFNRGMRALLGDIRKLN